MTITLFGKQVSLDDELVNLFESECDIDFNEKEAIYQIRMTLYARTDRVITEKMVQDTMKSLSAEELKEHIEYGINVELWAKSKQDTIKFL